MYIKELKIGDRAPDFNLEGSEEGAINLKDFLGKKDIILYFYPKNDTPGCIKEACDFRDKMGILQADNIVVLGVSHDAPISHSKFSKKYNLNFPLLSDKGGHVCAMYNCWIKKRFLWKKYMGVERTTFLIDKKGFIKQIWRKVKLFGHVDEVIKEVKGAGDGNVFR